MNNLKKIKKLTFQQVKALARLEIINLIGPKTAKYKRQSDIHIFDTLRQNIGKRQTDVSLTSLFIFSTHIITFFKVLLGLCMAMIPTCISFHVLIMTAAEITKNIELLAINITLTGGTYDQSPKSHFVNKVNLFFVILK